MDTFRTGLGYLKRLAEDYKDADVLCPYCGKLKGEKVLCCGEVHFCTPDEPYEMKKQQEIDNAGERGFESP